MIAIKNFSIMRDQVLLFEPVNIEIGTGEILTLMGPSGIGKSTFVDALSGILDPVFSFAGSFEIDGKDKLSIAPHKRRIGVLFQADYLFPHLNVEQNLLFGLKSKLRDRMDRKAVVAQRLESVGLAGYAQRDPSTLSGGQRARVSLLRTLLSEPDFLIFDEPFSKLDLHTKDSVRDTVYNLIRQQKIPTLVVTHDKEDARGRIVELAAPKG